MAVNVFFRGQYAAAQILFEKSLAIKRRLLTDNHEETAQAYGNLATALDTQGKYTQSQSLYEKELAIYRGLFGENNAFTASAYGGVAFNLDTRVGYAEAQPLIEKTLEIQAGCSETNILTRPAPSTIWLTTSTSRGNMAWQSR